MYFIGAKWSVFKISCGNFGCFSRAKTSIFNSILPIGITNKYRLFETITRKYKIFFDEYLKSKKFFRVEEIDIDIDDNSIIEILMKYTNYNKLIIKHYGITNLLPIQKHCINNGIIFEYVR